jgi:hypothetical protein
MNHYCCLYFGFRNLGLEARQLSQLYRLLSLLRIRNYHAIKLRGKTSTARTPKIDVNQNVTPSLIRQHMAKEAVSSALGARRQSSFMTLAAVYASLCLFSRHLLRLLYALRRTMIIGVQLVLWKNI